VSAGRWHIRTPGARIHGYHVPQFLSPVCTAGTLVGKWLDARENPTKEKVFWNMNLGLPYAGAGVKQITDAVLVTCRNPDVAMSVLRGEGKGGVALCIVV
ncbi:MAG: phage terminase large subunit family protein, partial [Chloroflexi bacterium]|nr:phage terminase large subunit family protein [Chloroflexota bacterium]